VTNPTLVVGTTYTASVYIKAGIQQNPQMVFASGANTSSFFATASLTGAGSITATGVSGAVGQIGALFGASCTPAGPTGSGWYLLQVTGSLGTGGNYQPSVYANGGIAYSGTGTTGAGPCFYTWQFQAEAGMWASSPIVTTSAQVTRALDLVSIPITTPVVAVYGSGIPQAPVLYPFAQRIGEVNDGSNNNRVSITRQSSTGKPAVIDVVGNTQFFGGTSVTAIPTGALMKAAIVCVAGNQSGAANGVAIATGSTGTVPTTTQANIGSNINSSSWNGYIERFALWTGTPPTLGQEIIITGGTNP
jgi:hypothetical protein